MTCGREATRTSYLAPRTSSALRGCEEIDPDWQRPYRLNPVSRGGRGAAERRKADSFALTGLFPRPATKETAFLYSASPHSASPRPPRATVFFTALSAQHSEAVEL